VIVSGFCQTDVVRYTALSPNRFKASGRTEETLTNEAGIEALL